MGVITVTDLILSSWRRRLHYETHLKKNSSDISTYPIPGGEPHEKDLKGCKAVHNLRDIRHVTDENFL